MNLAVAEVSGQFVGFGVGSGWTQFKIKVDGTTNKYNLSGLNYGFVGGYKKFFNDYIGLRYYVNIDLHHNVKKVSGATKTFKAVIANYGVNVDFLANFIAGNDSNFGVFIGAGIGANTLTGEDIWTLQDEAEIKTTGFDISANAGLRYNVTTTIDTNHGIEIAVRVPFLPVTMWNEYGEKLTYGQIFSVLARYTYSF